MPFNLWAPIGAPLFQEGLARKHFCVELGLAHPALDYEPEVCVLLFSVNRRTCHQLAHTGNRRSRKRRKHRLRR